MQYIKSKDNNKFKLAKSLLKPKYRNRENKYLAEGLRTVELAFEYGADIFCVFINEDFQSDISRKDMIEEMDSKSEVFVIANDLFRQISCTENTQGILAIVNIRRMSASEIDGKYRRAVVLDRVQDPGNMGTIIRTADAAGYDLIIMNRGCVDIYNPKVVRSTMGSLFYMDIVNGSDEEILEKLMENGISIISSYLKTENYYDDVDYPEKTALVVGNEANGISDFWIENSDMLVKIPMFGRAESLNVAVSTAILIYRIR